MQPRYFAEFHDHDLLGRLVPATGDRSVVILDGRVSFDTMRAIAADECKRRGYVAWRVMHGQFSNARIVIPLEHV